MFKTNLRPIQERIASLKTQTAQYEKMERIPGGPTQFIDSSLHEIKTDLVPKVVKFHDECMETLRKYLEGGQAIAKSASETAQSSALRMDEDHLRFLILEEVYLVPSGKVPEEVLQRARQQVSLEEVVSMMEQLATMYQELEEIGLEAQEVGQSAFGFTSLDSMVKELESMPDEDYHRLEPYLIRIGERRKLIEEFKKKFGVYLQLFYELVGQQTKELMAAQQKLFENVSYFDISGISLSVYQILYRMPRDASLISIYTKES
jgi:hypothetical protein